MSANTATKKQPQKPKMSGLGLDGIGDLSSLLGDPAAGSASGGPLEIPLDLIDEDPNQPRHADNPGFSKESLGELAATIRDRGVKSPISVRVHPEAEGRYIINHGARRYRASKSADKKTIPAFIDNDYNEADQVIENLQRNELTAREIADFIGRELATGKKKQAIAKEIGKSPAFVTQHVTLLDLPEPIADVFNAGRANDVTVVNELVKAYKKSPGEVGAWLDDDDQELTRGSVKLLREYLEDKRQHEEKNENPNSGNAEEEEEGGEESAGEKKPKKDPDPDQLKKAIVLVTHDGRAARLILNRRPPTDGFAWLKDELDGNEYEADLAQVQLVSIMEG